MSDINQENPITTENNENSAPQGKKQLTDTQLRIVQIAAGILCAAALVLSMFIPSDLIRKGIISENSLLNYLFVIVFLAITLGRRRIETQYQLRLNLFSLALVDGIVFGLMLYVIQILNDPNIVMADVYKTLIIAGGFLVLLILGILMPYLKYRKRVAEGTLPPIRIPEEKQPEDEEANAAAAAEMEEHNSSLERKVADMLSEAEQPAQELASTSSLEQKVADMLSEAEQTPAEEGLKSPAESAESSKEQQPRTF